MIYLIVPVIVVLYMIGGQKIKGVRRFGVPGAAVIGSIGYIFDDKTKRLRDKLKPLLFTLLIPMICVGYGENSWLKKKLRYEWLVRLVYAIGLSLPFIFFGKYFICLPLLIGAYQVHAGSLGKIGSFDILIEDILRGTAIGLSVAVSMGG